MGREQSGLSVPCGWGAFSGMLPARACPNPSSAASHRLQPLRPGRPLGTVTSSNRLLSSDEKWFLNCIQNLEVYTNFSPLRNGFVTVEICPEGPNSFPLGRAVEQVWAAHLCAKAEQG